VLRLVALLQVRVRASVRVRVRIRDRVRDRASRVALLQAVTHPYRLPPVRVRVRVS
jgi:hypothetical protein